MVEIDTDFKWKMTEKLDSFPARVPVDGKTILFSGEARVVFAKLRWLPGHHEISVDISSALDFG